MGGWSYPSYWCRICIYGDDALDAIESTGVELIALGREILDYNFIDKIQEGKR